MLRKLTVSKICHGQGNSQKSSGKIREFTRDYFVGTLLWTIDKVGDDPDFYNYVLFTDESTFHNNGLVNRHNFYYYDTANKHLFRTVDRQHPWSVNVRGGIVGEYVIGPYFLMDTWMKEYF